MDAQFAWGAATWVYPPSLGGETERTFEGTIIWCGHEYVIQANDLNKSAEFKVKTRKRMAEGDPANHQAKSKDRIPVVPCVVSPFRENSLR